jgi:putative ABC transport system permease protein
MKLLRTIPLVWKNVFRNRRRSILTILSMAISICLLGVMISLYWAFFVQPEREAQSLRLITINRVSITSVLPISYREKIAAVSGVDEAMVMQWYGGTYKDNRDIRNIFARYAVEPQKFFKVYPEYHVTEDEKQAFLHDRAGCMLGRPLASRLGLRLGDRVHIQGDIYPIDLDLTVRAIYDSTRDNQNFFFDNAYLEEGAPRFKNFAMMYIVTVRPGSSLQTVADTIDSTFVNSLAETKTDTERAFEVSFLSYLGDVKLFIGALAAALTFTILLVSGNTMAMSARERVREIGVLRTLGFSRGTLFGMLAGEGILLALVGGIIGTFLAEGICAGLRMLPSIMVDTARFRVTPGVAAECLAASLFIGFISSVVPSYGASRRGITEALRFVD